MASFMASFGPHANFIIAAYAVTILVVVLLIGWIITDFRRQTRILSDLESRGIRRRGDQRLKEFA